MFLKKSLFIIGLMASNLVFAGDYDQFNLIGFSKNGSGLAFETYSEHDGSGFPYDTITLVDVPNNKWLTQPINTEVEQEGVDTQAVRQLNQKKARKSLQKFGIVQGNLGRTVVSHLLTDLTPETKVVQFASEIGSLYKHGEYELTLNEQDAAQKDCAEYSDYEAKKLELFLKNIETGQQKVLQSDLVLPKSRNCAYSYRIEQVTLYQDYIVVFLNVFSPGFEGPNMRYIAVTGKLN